MSGLILVPSIVKRSTKAIKLVLQFFETLKFKMLICVTIHGVQLAELQSHLISDSYLS